ncbi:hypothetical protein CIB48_g1115 [Xylaria polymorpha]|nr:hypothetical protein CIB48_g1115 [Xylaria polymorpha]
MVVRCGVIKDHDVPTYLGRQHQRCEGSSRAPSTSTCPSLGSRYWLLNSPTGNQPQSPKKWRPGRSRYTSSPGRVSTVLLRERIVSTLPCLDDSKQPHPTMVPRAKGSPLALPRLTMG